MKIESTGYEIKLSNNYCYDMTDDNVINNVLRYINMLGIAIRSWRATYNAMYIRFLTPEDKMMFRLSVTGEDLHDTVNEDRWY